MKALYRRAQAYIQLADLDLAELDIKKALEIDPNNRFCSFSSVWILSYGILCDGEVEMFTLLSTLKQGCEVGVQDFEGEDERIQ